MNETKPKWYNSSNNPNALSLTIRGALLMYVPLILTLAAHFNLPLTEAQVTEWIHDASFYLAAAMMAMGFLRKVWHWTRRGKTE